MRRVVVIGGGPAGMTAARVAAAHGVAVVLIDAGAKLGGQYHRQDALASGDRFRTSAAASGGSGASAESADGEQAASSRDGQTSPTLADRGPAASPTGHDSVTSPTPAGSGSALPEGVEYVANAVVWAIEPVDGGHRVHMRIGPADDPSRQGRAIETRALVLATGAYDRALPFPGWDLPGVVTAGAAQALAKGQGVAVGDRILVGGTGPFLLPVAVSLIRAGARVMEVTDANAAVTGWLANPRGALAGWSKTGELARYAGTLARHGVPYRSRTAVITAHGTDVVESVTVARLDGLWTPIPGTERRVQVDAVAVGFGFTPQLELALASRCQVEDGFVVVDAAQGTSAPGVFAAGELTGIGGADSAVAEGFVAGAAAAKYVGAAVEPPLRAMARVRSGRKFAAALAAAYPVRTGWQDWLRDDTIVCRCEGITKRALFRSVDERDVGAARPLKLVSGVGLGLCQGRVCGLNAAELAGVDGTGFAKRPITSPVRLAELAEEEPVEGQIDAEESGRALGVEY